MAILTYHHIAPCPPSDQDHTGLWVSPQTFEAQLRWLREHHFVGYQVSELASLLVQGRAPQQPWVAITFDDGWYDNYTTALPLLVKYGLKATVFVTVGRLRKGQPTDDPSEMMSPTEIRELADKDIEIGSHTLTHPKLTRLDNEQALREIAGAREMLREILGQPPSTFSYPYGAFSSRVENLVREAGYIAAVSTIRDNRVRPDQLFHLPRVMVMGNTSLRRFAYMFSALYHWVHVWKNRKRWSGAA
ncbi:MAG: polysaccharide deacetylase family protein [Candidatus Sumerlaeaceae bacterium]|nr:polysaccharide deacetylase family protein [Candidatus Sumerlaeaceae bacterium]